MNNPMQILQHMLNSREVMNNPIMANAFQMLQKGDSRGIEELARNMCKEKNIDPDELVNKVRGQFGVK